MNRSECPVACSLDVVGDKWSLLIVRDLLKGKTKYDEFLSSPEGISTNILANRLIRLVDTGFVTRSPYQDRPTRFKYQLTQMGHDLGPIVKAMYDWGVKYMEKRKR